VKEEIAAQIQITSMVLTAMMQVDQKVLPTQPSQVSLGATMPSTPLILPLGKSRLKTEVA